jgi:hypothetical protein
MKKRIVCSAAALLATVASLAHGAGAHVHGRATLHVAVDGPTLTLNLNSPLDSLIGFEHAPRNDRQRAAVRRMVERLREAETLFVPTPEARCSRTTVNLESPVITPGLLAEEDAKKAPKRPAGKAEPGHADLDAEIVFRCEVPARLTGMEVLLFDAFTHMKRVDARIAASGKQAAAQLTSRNRRLTW